MGARLGGLLRVSFTPASTMNLVLAPAAAWQGVDWFGEGIGRPRRARHPTLWIESVARRGFGTGGGTRHGRPAGAGAAPHP